MTHLNRVAGPSCLIDLRQDWVLLGELEVKNDLRRAARGTSRVCANWSRSLSSCRHYLVWCRIVKEGERPSTFFSLKYPARPTPSPLAPPDNIKQHGEGPVSARAGAQTCSLERVSRK